MREKQDDRPRKEFRLHKPMSNDEIRAALGLVHPPGGHIPDDTYVIEVDNTYPSGCEFIGERTGEDTFNVVGTDPYRSFVEKAERIGEFVRDC